MVERQLDLLKGKRQKGVVSPGPSEFEIHCMVADYLRHGLAPGWMWFHPANGELRNKATGGRLKRMGVMPGVSDIVLVCAPHATLHALELNVEREAPPRSGDMDGRRAVDRRQGRMGRHRRARHRDSDKVGRDFDSHSFVRRLKIERPGRWSRAGP